tara:strand:- start:3 stop:818 length:816 start_codon:yes stop_codon:yes gene_type:complete
MPELPEVETVCKGLSNKILHKKVSGVKIFDSKLRKEIPPEIENVFEGKYIKEIIRRGKNGIIIFDGDYVLQFHLGMTGKFRFSKLMPTIIKHDHIMLKFTEGLYLIYNDVRKFGFFKLIKKPVDIVEFNFLGYEPNVINLFREKIISKIRSRSTSIKNILLNQSLIAGIGNIYASEILFSSGINPKLKGNNITKRKLYKMLIAIKLILDKAIKRGGTSIKDYNNVEGSLGYFQNSLKVYGREGLSCLNCKSLITKIKQSGRSTFYCKKCQR